MKYGEMAFRTGEGIISTTAWTGDVSCVGYGAILKQLRESGYNKTSVTEEVIPVVPLLNTVPLYAGTVRAICDCGDHAWGIIADCDSELKCLQYRDELFRARLYFGYGTKHLRKPFFEGQRLWMRCPFAVFPVR